MTQLRKDITHELCRPMHLVVFKFCYHVSHSLGAVSTESIYKKKKHIQSWMPKLTFIWRQIKMNIYFTLLYFTFSLPASRLAPATLAQPCDPLPVPHAPVLPSCTPDAYSPCFSPLYLEKPTQLQAWSSCTWTSSPAHVPVSLLPWPSPSAHCSVLLPRWPSPNTRGPVLLDSWPHPLECTVLLFLS
jgi:hypothetical protein